MPTPAIAGGPGLPLIPRGIHALPFWSLPRRGSVTLGGATTLLSAQQSSMASSAPKHMDASVAFRLGTLGLGLEVGKLLTNHIAARVGVNYFKHTTTRAQTGISYAASIKLQAFSALVDFFPGNRGSFHLTGGIMTDPAKIDGTGKPTSSGTFKINGNTYTSAQVGTLTGNIKFPSVGPYLGLGFGTPARNGGALKFLFDLGVVVGKPKFTLSSTGAAANPGLAADLTAQEKTTQNDLDKLKVYPVLSFGLAYRF
jgi:hypothetical protein